LNKMMIQYLLSLVRSRKFLLSLSLAFFALFFVGLLLNFAGNAKPGLLKFVSHIFIIFTSLVLAIDLMLLSKIAQITPVKEEWKCAEKKMYAIFVVISLSYVALAYTEILLFGHTFYAPILLAFSALFYILVAKTYSAKESIILIYLPLLLAMFITAHYIVFPPSFGNDTWRDIMWSEETLRTGYFTRSRIAHLAYPVPMVVLLYSMASLIGGFTATDSSAVIGLLYLFILGITMLTLLRRIYERAEKNVVATLLLLTYSTPLITLWSVWFVPQSLALIFMALLLLFIKLERQSWIAQLVLATALVFSHPGTALYTLVYFTFLFIFHGKNEKLRRPLLFISIIYIVYVIYTSVQYMVSSAAKQYLDYLLAVLLGREVGQVQAPAEMGPLNRLFPWIPETIAIIFGVNALYANSLRREKSNEWEVLTVPFSVITLVIQHVVSTIQTTLPVRYVGLPAIFLLILSSHSGVKVLKVGRLSKGFLYGLEALLIAVLAFGGTFTPLNPMVLNPSHLSVYGLPTYADAKTIRSITTITIIQNSLIIYTDWRTGLLYTHDLMQKYNVSIHSSSWSITLGNLQIRLFGYYGRKYEGDLSFMHSDSILILRATSFTMIESWGRFKPELSYGHSNISKMLDAGGIAIYAGR